MGVPSEELPQDPGFGAGVADPADMPAVTDMPAPSDMAAPPDSGTTGRKWNPGHYPYADTLLFPSKASSYSTFRTQLASVPAGRIAGTKIIVAWGQLEPTVKGTYDWALLDQQIAAFAAMGYKVMIALWWQQFAAHTYAGGAYSPALPTAPQSGEHYLPDYVISQALSYGSATTTGVKLWEAAAMDHYLAFLAAVAARYDNDDRIAAVVSEEGAFGPPLDGSIATASMQAGLHTQMLRLVAQGDVLFVRTPFFLYNNFVGGPDYDSDLTQAMVDLGVGVGAPDTQVAGAGPISQYNMRYLQGQRYQAGAWVNGAGADQRQAAIISVDKQVNRSMTWTPQSVYDGVVADYRPQFFPWSLQTTAYLYNHSGDPAFRIPAMDRSAILAWFASAAHPVRTDQP